MALHARVVCLGTDFYKPFSLQARQPREMTTVSEVCGEPELEWWVCLTSTVFGFAYHKLKFLELGG